MTLLDDVGGRIAASALVDRLFAGPDAEGNAGRLVDDPVLGGFFRGTVLADHRISVTNTLCSLLAGEPGPLDRTREVWLADAHRGRGISRAHFARLTELVASELRMLGVRPSVRADVLNRLWPLADVIVDVPDDPRLPVVEDWAGLPPADALEFLAALDAVADGVGFTTQTPSDATITS